MRMRLAASMCLASSSLCCCSLGVSHSVAKKEAGKTAQQHAIAACVAIHRPNQITFEQQRAVSQAETDQAAEDARNEADIAAALDSSLQDFATAVTKLADARSSVDRLKGVDGYADFERYFPMVRARCLVLGAGDINRADMDSASRSPSP